LGRPPVEDQITALEALTLKYPKLSKELGLYRTVLEARVKIEESLTKGVKLNWSDPSVIDDLQKYALTKGLPIVNFLNPEAFNREKLFTLAKEIAHKLSERGFKKKELLKFLEKMETDEAKLTQLLDASLKQNSTVFRRLGRKLYLNPSVMLLVINTSIQPCLEYIARRLRPSFLDRWGKTSCPVCGRTPIIAKIKNSRRYLTCMLCGVEYPSDIFICAHCGNRDPYSLKFIAPEGQPEFEVDFCERCKHYVKVINEDKLKTPIPSGLEDMLTVSLDRIAKQAGLKRNW
jgi:FdhE protein